MADTVTVPAMTDTSGTLDTGLGADATRIRPRKAVIVGSRTALVMLLVAGLAVLGLGVAATVFGDAEVDGRLRDAFGRVFGAVALLMAVALGVPAVSGLSAMAGAGAEDAVPALPSLTRRVLVGVAVATVVVTALVVLTNDRGPLVIDLGLIGLVALSTLGLAGAVASSPHRGRGWLSAAALILVAGGTLWVLTQV